MKPQSQHQFTPQPRSTPSRTSRPQANASVANASVADVSPVNASVAKASRVSQRAASDHLTERSVSERPVTDLPLGKVEDIDFYALRQNRIRQEELLASTVVAPTEKRLRQEVAAEEADPFARDEEQKFERLVKSKPRKPRSAPCAPCHLGLLICSLLLCAISVPLVYSASTPIALDQHAGNADFFLTRQLGFGAIGLMLMVMFSRLSGEGLRKWAWIFYGVSVMGLLATKFTPLGFSMGNTERWVKLGPLTLQFSELAKVALLGVMADFWSRSMKAGQKPAQAWLGAGAITFVPFALTLIQPHLSAALLLFAIPLFAAFFAGAPKAHFVRLFSVLGVMAALVIGMCKTHSVPFMAPYQQDRIAAKIGGGDDDARGGDYQALQGQRAIMSGGVAGRGLGNSLYKQGHLPAPHTDFIYAVVAEEMGLWGALGLILLYGLIVFFCFQTGHSTRDPFQSILCASIGGLFGLQVVGNIAVVTGLAPVTGMPLPILTYGGSGLICALIGIGIVLAVSRTQSE